MKKLQIWILQLIISAIALACAHYTSIRPIGEDWSIQQQKADSILFGRRTDNRYHTIFASAEILHISKTIEVSGTRRAIGNIIELSKYIDPTKIAKEPSPRFKNIDSKILITSYYGNDCVRVDFTAEDHGVPNAEGQIFILIAQEYYCFHPATTDSDTGVFHLYLSQRYPKGKKPLSVEAEVEPFFSSYIKGSTIPFIKASKEGDLATLQTLITSGADVNVKGDVISDWGKTALMEASLRGYTDIAKALLKGGADVNAEDDYGDTALMFAAGKGHYEIIKLLLNAGAKVNILNKGSKSTALMMAAKNGYTEIVNALIDAGTDININSGESALTLAAWKGAVPTVQTLIERGADVNAKNFMGMTPLMFMVKWGDVSIVQTLIEKGANVNAKNNYDMSVLDFAKEHMEIIDLLKKAGAKEK